MIPNKNLKVTGMVVDNHIHMCPKRQRNGEAGSNSEIFAMGLETKIGAYSIFDEISHTNPPSIAIWHR